MAQKQTILITGCSDGGLGSALAIAFHEAGWRVFASARNTQKLKETEDVGIESIQLDVLSQESIATAKAQITKLTGGSLNALLNNAGAGYSMPFLDMDVQKVRDVFELNVFSNITMIQAFTPLLLEAAPDALLINNTSIASIFGMPIQSAYNASKAATAMFTTCLRLELEAMGIKVVDLRTGAIKTNFMANMNSNNTPSNILPKNSYYSIAREAFETFILGKWVDEGASDRHVWARQIVKGVSKKSPSHLLWKGAHAVQVWMGSFLPPSLFDGIMKQRTGLGIFERKLKEQGGVVKAGPK